MLRIYTQHPSIYTYAYMHADAHGYMLVSCLKNDHIYSKESPTNQSIVGRRPVSVTPSECMLRVCTCSCVHLHPRRLDLRCFNLGDLYTKRLFNKYTRYNCIDEHTMRKDNIIKYYCLSETFNRLAFRAFRLEKLGGTEPGSDRCWEPRKGVFVVAFHSH